jgi:tetratricopeptide (TPR) repeat protein
MDPERWKQVDEMLQSALRLPSGERSAFLRQACNGDFDLEENVRSLLIAQRQVDGFLERPAIEVAARALADSEKKEPGPDLTNEFIGPYRLVQPLGAGGMGEVWRAEQTAPIRRTVALKLIKAGMDTKAVVARFDSERQALAMMDHPNIAKVFDAGATATGRPYFVMEYVPGVPITEYCDQHRLTIKERLELFIHVCEGVLHAHQKAIIHRDLKPSNILVIEADAKPVPKIIDFGLAKATAGNLTEHSMFTELGVMVGTPAYMSPEQAGSQDGNIDTRTDVYSLGVILFELLVGTLPFASQDLRKSGVEAMLRKIRETESPLPSVKLSSLGQESGELASRRKEEPATLVRHLRGDLDWITIKAMEKDRTRRYASPAELAADIRRHLEDQPVLAGPPSAGYRARKFVRRHRVGVAVAVAALVLLLGFSAAMIVQARRIARERDHASREAAVAKSVSDFLISLFAVSDPSEAQGNKITARELLDRGRGQVETALNQQPEVQARMMDTMGRVYLALGLPEQAQPLIEKSLSIQRQVLGQEHPDTLTSMDHLSQVLEREGRYPEAEKLIRFTLDARTRVLGQAHPDTLSSRHALTLITVDKGNYAEAEKLNREELDVLRRVRGPEHPDTLFAMYTLAVNLANQGRPIEAVAQYRETLELSRHGLGSLHPITLRTMNALGGSLADLEKYDEAEKLLREALNGARQVWGPEHPQTLWVRSNLASEREASGHATEAESLDRETLIIRSRVLGPEHPETLMTMTNLATDLDDLGRFREAEAIFRQTIEIKRRVLGDNHPGTAVTKYNLAVNLMRSKRPKEALAELTDAVEHGLAPGFAIGIERDPEFQSLKDTPGFISLLAHIHEKAGAAR